MNTFSLAHYTYRTSRLKFTKFAFRLARNIPKIKSSIPKTPENFKHFDTK